MRDYGDDFRRREPGWGGPGYDFEYGNWGARSGLSGGWGGSARSDYDRGWRGGRFAREPWSGYGSGAPRRPSYGGGYRSPEGVERGGRAGYDRGYGGARGGYDRDVGGWGMTGLHQQIMRERGEGFGYGGDYDRSHPLEGREWRGRGRGRWR